jgi:two-component system phosphate regulon response regulator PhoB
MSKKPLLLAVDDNPVNLLILEEMLSEEFEVESALDGTEAMRRALAIRPDILLLDVMMPGINGLDVCRQIRNSLELSEMRIILVSAMALPSEREAGIRAGADSYVTKPFNEEKLLETIHSFKGKRDGNLF